MGEGGPYDIPGMHGYSPRFVIGPYGNIHVAGASGGYTRYAFHSGSNLSIGWVGPSEHVLGGWGDAAGIAADSADAGLLCVEVGEGRSGDTVLIRYVNGSPVSEQQFTSGLSATGYRWPSMSTDYGSGNTYIFARGFESGDSMERWIRSPAGSFSGPVVIRARGSGVDFDCPIVAARNGMVRYIWRESPGSVGERFGAYWTDGVSPVQTVLPGYTISPTSAVLDPNGNPTALLLARGKSQRPTSREWASQNFTLTYAPTEKVVGGDMEGGFFSTGWASTCSGQASKLPNPSSSWGWNNDASYPFNTWDSISTKHADSHALVTQPEKRRTMWPFGSFPGPHGSTMEVFLISNGAEGGS